MVRKMRTPFGRREPMDSPHWSPVAHSSLPFRHIRPTQGEMPFSHHPPRPLFWSYTPRAPSSARCAPHLVDMGIWNTPFSWSTPLASSAQSAIARKARTPSGGHGYIENTSVTMNPQLRPSPTHPYYAMCVAFPFLSSTPLALYVE